MSATPVPCRACGETIRRSTGLGLCAACRAIERADFEAGVKGLGPDAYMRTFHARYAGKNPPAIAAARAALAVAL